MIKITLSILLFTNITFGMELAECGNPHDFLSIYLDFLDSQNPEIPQTLQLPSVEANNQNVATVKLEDNTPYALSYVFVNQLSFGLHCVVCNDEFDTPHKLKSHYKHFHTDAPETLSPIPNKEAIKSCLSKSSLKTFKKKRKKSLPMPAIKKVVIASIFACSDCNKKFKTKKELTNHNARIHPSDHAPLYKCKALICDKSYRCLSSALLHYARKHREARFACEEEDCNAKYSVKGDLNQHYSRAHK